jgi:protein CpxP
MTLLRSRGALAALALTLLAAPAFAQAPAPGAGDHGPDRARMHEMMEKHRAAMSQDLHTVLNIHPGQEAAFSAFQASMTPPPRDDHMKDDRAKMAAMTTPQRLDMMLAKMDEHTARMRQHIQATKTFYAALTPEQQHVFDALDRLHHGMHGGHGGRGGPHEGPMHGGEGPPPPPGE